MVIHAKSLCNGLIILFTRYSQQHSFFAVITNTTRPLYLWNLDSLIYQESAPSSAWKVIPQRVTVSILWANIVWAVSKGRIKVVDPQESFRK
jgi:hypothetical protein